MDETIFKLKLVEISDAYTSYVNLQHELFNDDRNQLRMANYRPVASHRQAFQKLAGALRVRDKRVYLLTGAYGTGKSHLCLMFANYLQIPSGEKPMSKFFDFYAETDPDAAEELRSKRLNGRYLVALCDWGGRGDFEEVVLRAVDEALRRENFGEDFDTHYLQAVRKIEEWERYEQEGGDHRADFLSRFRDALDALTPRQTVEGFKKKLLSFDFATLEEFKRIHLSLTTAPFSHDKSDLVTILTDTLSSEKFKERFLGLLVLWDEFGDTMERGNLSPKMFQKFAELAAETPPQCARLIFVGTAHKALTEYAKAYNAIDFRTASDRIEPVGLTPDGVEDIISAIISVKTDHPVWQQKIAPKAAVFDGFVRDCNRLKLFDWLTGPKIRKNIIEKIYPLHPMATYALLRLARDIASNNRSVFTYFAGDLSGEPAPGSYGHFIGNEPVENNGKLNLYTADRLYEYFADMLNSDNRELRETLREIVRDYEESRRVLNRVAGQDMDTRLNFLNDPLVERLLRLMLIYAIIGIENREENIIFGLYATTGAEQTEIKNRLAALNKKDILYYDKDTKVYQFRQSKNANLDHLIDEYKKKTENQPTNLASELEQLVPLGRNEAYLEAKDYNLPYSEDKRLDRRLVRVADLSYEEDTAQGIQTYFDRLEAELEANARRSEYEGIALYVLCETQDEIQRARDLCARNKSDRIVVAVPKNPVPLLDAVMEVRALRWIEGSEQAKNFTTQDKTALDSRLNGDSTRPGAINNLKSLRDRLMEHREVNWLGRFANPLPVDLNKPYDAANRVMEKLYSANRNLFTHDDFNKLRFRIDRARNAALKEAVEELLDFTEPIVIDTSFAQARGDIRYMQKCMLNNGVLTQERVNGSKILCKVEKDPAKYAKQLPALAAMVRDVERLSPGESLNINEWLTKFRKPPYGQGPVSLCISLASIRRIFGDSIRIKEDRSSIGELPLRDFDSIVNLFEGKYTNATLSYRPLRTEERALANLIFRTFGEPETAVDAARDITLQEAYNALRSWWEDLPPLARVTQLYRTDSQHAAVRFIKSMEMIAAKDPHSFLLEELPAAFGAGEGLAVTRETVTLVEAELPQVKDNLEHSLEKVEERIIAAVRTLFGAQQHAYSGIIETISNWYDSLDSDQRDPHAPWHNNDSKPLVTHLKTLTDLRETFMERIPASPDYGLNRVSNWITDHVDEYIERLRRGKEWIEQNSLKVDPAEVIPEGKFQQADGQISFQGDVTLTIRPKNPGDKIFVAEGFADPTTPESIRAEYQGDAVLKISDHKTLRYVVQDTEGNWGRVETIKLVNEAKKYELNVERQRRMNADDLAQCAFPKDKGSFKITLRSLVRLSLQRKAITPEELDEAIKAVLDEIEG